MSVALSATNPNVIQVKIWLFAHYQGHDRIYRKVWINQNSNDAKGPQLNLLSAIFKFGQNDFSHQSEYDAPSASVGDVIEYPFLMKGPQDEPEYWLIKEVGFEKIDRFSFLHRKNGLYLKRAEQSAQDMQSQWFKDQTKSKWQQKQ